MRLQAIFKTTHIWLGLVCGAVLCLTCLSGSIAVFRPQLQNVFSPKVTASKTQADLDRAVARVLAQNPDARLTRVSLPTPDLNIFVLTLESSEPKPPRIVIDAGTGATAGEIKLTWLDWIIDLHHNLLGGHTGRHVVGVVGIVLLVMSLSGLVLTLLRNPSWNHLITVRAGGPRRRFYFELHRATGLWAYTFLTLLSFTGVALAFPEAFRAVFGQTTAIAKPKPSPHDSFRPLKDYIAMSRTALPSAQLTELRIPKSPKDAISMRFRIPSDLGDTGRNELLLDASGRILGVQRIADEPVGARFQASFSPIHYGEVGGFAVRALWCLAGIAPLALYITGILVWFRKKPHQKFKKQPDRDEFLVTPRSL